MRALLLFNPNATTTDDRVRDVIASALASAVELDVQPTKQRGHATHIVAGAVHEGVDAVFALGGDGTANEVLQALVGTDVRLGIIPGGGANVLARSLGLPNDAVAATSVLLEHLRADRTRRITLGRANERWFGFNAGFGFDAAVVRHVEQHPQVKRVFRQAAFVASTTREWFVGEGRGCPRITLHHADGSVAGPYLVAVVANTDPYTFLGPRPMHVHPRASFDLGLDLVGIRRVSTVALLRILNRVFRDGEHVRAKGLDYVHDLAAFTLSSPEPLPLMVDGDYSGEHLQVTFAAVPDALRVLA
ncbi:diacylglycerol/lipid kinase family protein [Egicoccus halophilus]|uniref:Diacylglycerol kinase n=1 Tax=Egicoccus halophilus TaxID=1670830 RepID=A0A8J3ESQ4_9ACTN|nr:diacylglycerol kinase family protein [Egicoccus halophilus]GGI03954.1 diacylglycerol kinase [Egicoccus halophilus]